MADSYNSPHIILIKNGPLKISGSYKLVNDRNEELSSGEELYLCRCGKSSNAPYCDGSHKSNKSAEGPDNVNNNCD